MATPLSWEGKGRNVSLGFWLRAKFGSRAVGRTKSRKLTQRCWPSGRRGRALGRREQLWEQQGRRREHMSSQAGPVVAEWERRVDGQGR